MNDELADETITDLLRTLERTGVPPTARRREQARRAMLDAFDDGVPGGLVPGGREAWPPEDDGLGQIVELTQESAPELAPTWRRRLPMIGAAGLAAALLAAMLWTTDPSVTPTEVNPATPAPAPALGETRSVSLDLGEVELVVDLPEEMQRRDDGAPADEQGAVVGLIGSAPGTDEVRFVAVDPMDLAEAVSVLSDSGEVTAVQLQLAIGESFVDAWDLTLAGPSDPGATCDGGEACTGLFAGAPESLAIRGGVNHRVAAFEVDDTTTVIVMIRGERISAFSVLAAELVASITIS